MKDLRCPVCGQMIAVREGKTVPHGGIPCRGGLRPISCGRRHPQPFCECVSCLAVQPRGGGLFGGIFDSPAADEWDPETSDEQGEEADGDGGE